MVCIGQVGELRGCEQRSLSRQGYIKESAKPKKRLAKMARGNLRDF